MASANIAGYELDEVSESEFEGLGDVLLPLALLEHGQLEAGQLEGRLRQ